MIDYQIVSSTERDQVEKLVRRYLKDGWKLDGGVSVSISHRSTAEQMTVVYAQAITTEIKKEDWGDEDE